MVCVRKKRLPVALGLALLVLGVVLWDCLPWEMTGLLSYWRIELGMTEPEIVGLLGSPSTEHRVSRHIGGVTSPGCAEVLYRESGLPFEDLPKRFGDKARNGQDVTVRQWWSRNYAIDVAFDENGAAVGVYLMKLRRVNS